MRVLGLSSATKIISLGLIEDDKVLVEATVAGVQTERLMFYVKEAGIKPEQIEGVAVTIGPGSYSGLRGGIATAKSLAQTLSVPIVGISTLEAIAYNLVEVEGTMAVVLDARADEYNFALFGASSGSLKRLTNDLVLKLEHIVKKLQEISGEIYLVGNLSEIRNRLVEGKGKYRFVGEIHSLPYGINVAKLGWQKIKARQIDDPLKLIPRYSHKPSFREFFKRP